MNLIRNKKLLIFSISCLILLVISGMYFTYGYLGTSILGNETSKKAVFNAQIIKVEYSDGTETIKTDIDGYFIPGSTITKTFTIKNTGNAPVKYSVNLSNVVNKFERKNDITYEISDGTNTYSNIFPSNDTYIIPKETLEINESKTYTLNIKYSKSSENQIVDSGKTIGATITIDDSVTTLNKLIVYGNSIQNGTPTPDSPIEIENLGDKTINLVNHLDVKESSSTKGSLDGATITKDYIDMVRRNQYDYASIPISLKSGKTYTVYYEIEVYDMDESARENGGKSTVLALGFGAESSKQKSYTQNTTDRLVYTYTASEDIDTNVRVIANYGSTIPARVKFKVMVVEGNYTLDTIPEFEPYGYKIPIKQSGKNLFRLDKDSSTSHYNSTFETLENGFKANGILDETVNKTHYKNGFVNVYSSNPISIGEYTFSYKQVCDGEIPENSPINLYGKDSKGTRIFSANKKIYYDKNSLRYSTTFTTDLYIPIFYAEVKVFGMNCTLTDFQIEKTNTTTEYESFIEPQINYLYLEEPLRKVGDCATCADSIDFTTGKIVRNIKEYQFNGEEAWVIYNTSGINQFYFPLSGMKHPLESSMNKNIISNIYNGISIDNRNNNFNTIYTYSDGLAINDNRYSTVDEFKTYITTSGGYAYYVLSSPIEKEINLPDIKLLQNSSNNISVCSSNTVCASNIEVETN